MEPTGTLKRKVKLPAPLLRRIDTVLAFEFEVAASRSPSPSKSTSTRPVGDDPGGRETLGPGRKPPRPSPKSTFTASVDRRSTTRSGLPSPLTSPAATEAGFVPTVNDTGPEKPPPVFRRTDTVLAR